MAGRSPSEEMDAFDDVTPAKPVSIYDLDEDLPTRAQSSEEIAEFQAKAREKARQKTAAAPAAAPTPAPAPAPEEKREAAHRSFRAPTDSSPGERLPTPDPGSGSNPRPVPRESGPVRIDRYKPAPAPAPPPPSLDEALHDVAATLDRLPPAPRVPKIEQPRGSLETIPTLSGPPPRPAPAPRRTWPITLLGVILLGVAGWIAFAFFR